MQLERDVIIIGGGASGLMCAIAAGRRKRTVLLIEHTGKIASKIRVSGGGRCNFTNLHLNPGDYFSQNPDFCKSALSRFTPEDFTNLLDKYGVPYSEKENGQLFCRNTSRDIVDILHAECRNTGVGICLHQDIRSIEKKDIFTITTDRHVLKSHSLVVATGGLSYARLGASALGYQIARQFGIKITPLRPALVPLIFSPEDSAFFRELTGVSLYASVRCGKISSRGEILFTHRGMSGPAVLQTSLYWKKGDTITIDLMPDLDALELFMTASKRRIEMHTLLSRHLPKRFSKMFCDRYLLSRPVYQYNHKELEAIALKLHNWPLRPVSTAGYDEAEVTAGGIDTNDLSSKTFEAKKVPGLYFIGEILDVTGKLGGFNLHWAWASGSAAGHYV
ncbi:MAG TPA: NAD(P)/FAD-dependent oxidoreductase [Candidatus Sulfobium mesophilum]|nr:NAD(P)/FAD-dependent oxidoreductase [Candidatus Sulfobium mesophilum]